MTVLNATRLLCIALMLAGLSGCLGSGGGLNVDSGGAGDHSGSGSGSDDRGGSGDGSDGASGAAYQILDELPEGTVLTLHRGQGLETASIGTGISITIDDAATDAKVTLNDRTSEKVFTLTLPDGRSAIVDTQGDNEDVTAPDGALQSEDAISDGTDRLHLTDYGEAYGLQYTEFGGWDVSTASDDVYSIGVWSTGNETLEADVPATGTATFTGGAQGYANVGGTAALFSGDASFSADFGNGSLTGNVTDIKTAAIGSSSLQTMSGISFDGTINGGGFSGTADATVDPAGRAFDVDLSGATGAFGGHFYGPDAQELGGSFTLEGGANNVSLIGSFGAKQ